VARRARAFRALPALRSAVFLNALAACALARIASIVVAGLIACGVDLQVQDRGLARGLCGL